MLDTAIVGGGLCGLALAHSLHARRRHWSLFEARERLGGRALTVAGANGAALDLGPTWYWPATQPSVAALVEALGLPSVAQPDDGRVLLLDDPARTPVPRAVDAGSGGLRAEGDPRSPQADALHAGARRLRGGIGALVQALAQRLPAERVHTGCRLVALTQRADHVELAFADRPPQRARRVVLALPPRLVLERVALTPALPVDTQAALRAAPTWMASAAKAALALPAAPWRDAPARGNAWVTHAQAVLAEVWDAGGESEGEGEGEGEAPAALAGFVALDAAQRQRFRTGLPLLVESQVGMLHGVQAQPLSQHLQDWATEPDTCSALDRDDEAGLVARPDYGDPRLAVPLWGGRLWLGGSETASVGGGLLEGALRAAARLRRQLDDAHDACTTPRCS